MPVRLRVLLRRCPLRDVGALRCEIAMGLWWIPVLRLGYSTSMLEEKFTFGEQAKFSGGHVLVFIPSVAKVSVELCDLNGSVLGVRDFLGDSIDSL